MERLSVLAIPLVFFGLIFIVLLTLAATPDSKDHITAIKKLKKLYDSGIISKQEFEKGVNKHINSRIRDDYSTCPGIDYFFGAESVLKEYKALLEDGVITRTQYEKRAKRLIKKIRNNAKL